MFSEYYGESGKVVDKVFSVIESMLDEDENTFICVVVDDIESLAGKRECYSSSNEPHDSLRVRVNTIYILAARLSLMLFQAVNALLAAIDRLRYRPNVALFCTSNLIKTVVRKSSELATYEFSLLMLIRTRHSLTASTSNSTFPTPVPEVDMRSYVSATLNLLDAES